MSKPSSEAIAAAPDEDFAVPETRQLWLKDSSHVKMAWNNVQAVKGLSPDQRAAARARIIERAKLFEMDTSRWENRRVVDQPIFVSISAMSLDMPTDAHPNKMPFTGILTRIGEPSDSAPHGSDGKRVMLTIEAAQRALPSLLGMGVNYNPEGHSPQEKIGIIDAATIEANAIRIGGFIYAHDFPKIAAEIKANKDKLGFSFEARDLFTTDSDADPVPIVECCFTGAAILLKENAAYTSTSIQAAKVAANEVLTMDAEVQKHFADLADTFTKALKPIADAVTAQGESIKKLENDRVEAANHLAKVEKHAAELEKAADHMDAAGIGGHPTRGHATILRNMAGDLRAAAAKGVMPAVYDGFYAASDATNRNTTQTVDVEAAVKTAVEKATGELTKQLGDVKAAAEKADTEHKAAITAAETKLKDLQAAADAAKRESNQPERKTLSPGHTQLLAKAGVELPTDGKKLDIAVLNKALAGVDPEKRIEVKAALHGAGIID